VIFLSDLILAFFLLFFEAMLRRSLCRFNALRLTLSRFNPGFPSSSSFRLLSSSSSSDDELSEQKRKVGFTFLSFFLVTRFCIVVVLLLLSVVSFLALDSLSDFFRQLIFFFCAPFPGFC
jgi:hypothetical protein